MHTSSWPPEHDPKSWIPVFGKIVFRLSLVSRRFVSLAANTDRNVECVTGNRGAEWRLPRATLCHTPPLVGRLSLHAVILTTADPSNAGSDSCTNANRPKIVGRLMTDTSLTARFAEGDFRVGRIINRTSSVLSRNFLPFFIVTAIANLPGAVLVKYATDAAATTPEALVQNLSLIGLALVLTALLNALCQAIVLYGAFQDMRGRPVNLTESLQVGLRRFLPILVLAFVAYFCIMLGIMLLIVPGFI